MKELKPPSLLFKTLKDLFLACECFSNYVFLSNIIDTNETYFTCSFIFGFLARNKDSYI